MVALILLRSKTLKFTQILQIQSTVLETIWWHDHLKQPQPGAKEVCKPVKTDCGPTLEIPCPLSLPHSLRSLGRSVLWVQYKIRTSLWRPVTGHLSVPKIKVPQVFVILEGISSFHFSFYKAIPFRMFLDFPWIALKWFTACSLHLFNIKSNYFLHKMMTIPHPEHQVLPHSSLLPSVQEDLYSLEWGWSWQRTYTVFIGNIITSNIAHTTEMIWSFSDTVICNLWISESSSNFLLLHISHLRSFPLPFFKNIQTGPVFPCVNSFNSFLFYLWSMYLLTRHPQQAVSSACLLTAKLRTLNTALRTFWLYHSGLVTQDNIGSQPEFSGI